MGKKDFYLSYSGQDGAEIASGINSRMTEAGYTVWSAGSTAGWRSFAKQSAAAIADCRYFVPIITESATRSEQMKTELSEAISKAESRGIRIIPVIAARQVADGLYEAVYRFPQIYFSDENGFENGVQRVVEQLCRIAENDRRTALLYEKLLEYKKLDSRVKVAQTLCDLIQVTRERYYTDSCGRPEIIWKQGKELVAMYAELSAFSGGYDEETREVARRILQELDETYEMLSPSRKTVGVSPFQTHILLAAVAVRLIHYDRKIRCECADILSAGKVKDAFPVLPYMEKQKVFLARIQSDYAKLQLLPPEHAQFVEETRQYLLTYNRNEEAVVRENAVYAALTKCGYTVEMDYRLGNAYADFAILINGKALLFIECTDTPDQMWRAMDGKKRLEKQVEAVGGRLHFINTADWDADPLGEIEKIRSLVASFSTPDEQILLQIARFVQEENKLFDVLQKGGVAGSFLECLLESYQRLEQYCSVVGAKDIAAECAGRIVEIRKAMDKPDAAATEKEKVEKGIKSLLGYTLEDSGKYDVFISFKNEDADLAERIYDYCHRRMKVPFWSKKSLPRLSKSEYSLAIDAALESAKHFVVVVSDLKYLDAEWIKYEMDVFHNEIKEGRKKNANFVIVATDDVYEQIIRSNKTVLNIAYRRYQIIKMSQYEDSLAQYFS